MNNQDWEKAAAESGIKSGDATNPEYKGIEHDGAEFARLNSGKFIKIKNNETPDSNGDIIPSATMKSAITDYMERLRRDIEARKDAILSVKLDELGVDLEQEKQKRFPNIQCIVNGKGEETWYYNDGSEQGKEIITFWVQYPKYENPSTIELKHT